MKNKWLIPSVATFFVLVFGIYGYVAATGEQITVCVKKSGLVYVIGEDFKRIECKDSDSILSWNTIGLQGLKGDKGDQGLPGTPSWDENRIMALEVRITELENSLTQTNPCLSVSTSGLITDDFNSYIDGSILGQGGWVDRANGSNFVIQGSVKCEGAKALHNVTLADSIVSKSGLSLADGRQSFYIKTENRNDWGDYPDGNVQMRVSKESWDSASMIAMTLKKDGNVAFYNPITDSYQNFGTYNDNEWTLVEVEWQSSDKTARYRINNTVWTSWSVFKGGTSFIDFDTVSQAFTLPSGGGGVYFDYLQ